MSNVLKIFLCLVLLAIFTTVGKLVILGGVENHISLQSAPPLSGIISQSLSNRSSSKNLPVAGKDYTINNLYYLDNNAWVVASITSKNVGKATLVLRNVNGVYQAVLGPGTFFANSDLNQLPPEVVAYLNSQGVNGYDPAD